MKRETDNERERMEVNGQRGRERIIEDRETWSRIKTGADRERERRSREKEREPGSRIESPRQRERGGGMERAG